MTTDFRETSVFKRGSAGERLVAALLQSRGWFILPAYDYSGEGGNTAPRLQGELAGYVAPDILAARNGKCIWVEVKTKEHADYTRVTDRMEHGFSLRHLEAYRGIQEITGIPVWLAIYEEDTGDIRMERIDSLPEPRITDMKKGALNEGKMAYFAQAAFKVANK